MADYTNSWTILDPTKSAQAITAVSTVQNHPLGTRVKARDDGTTSAFGEGEFIYLKGVGSTAIGTWVTYTADDWGTARLAANAIAPVAVAMAAIDATTKYGWYQIWGKAVGLALASYADNGLVYATATAGSVDDAAVSGDRVKCALGASAIDHPDTGFAEFEIHYPYMDDGSAA